MIGTNILGLVLFAAAFAPVLVLFKETTKLEQALLTSAGGLVCGLLDLGYRKLRNHESMIEPDGPQILYMPAWLLGGVWVVVGIVKSILVSIQE